MENEQVWKAVVWDIIWDKILNNKSKNCVFLINAAVWSFFFTCTIKISHVHAQTHPYRIETSSIHISLATQNVIYRPGSLVSLLEIQSLKPHPWLSDSEPAFSQDPWMILVHSKFEKYWWKIVFLKL
jgi:hypothetical protein